MDEATGLLRTGYYLDTREFVTRSALDIYYSGRSSIYAPSRYANRFVATCHPKRQARVRFCIMFEKFTSSNPTTDLDKMGSFILPNVAYYSSVLRYDSKISITFYKGSCGHIRILCGGTVC